MVSVITWKWIERLEHNFHAEFKRSLSTPSKTMESGIIGGEVRSARHGAGNVAFVQVYEAGQKRRWYVLLTCFDPRNTDDGNGMSLK
ncbi:hypothetical protein AcV5_005359 [Taiwanofungus camphoratus]|nr:hypothetical protein AcV5_005359 [Antrodia cinnamomea]